MEKIIMITEAFSMQPKNLEVISEETFESYYDKPNACKEIKLETIEIGKKFGDPVEELYYVGYNFEGKKLFQFIANTVNVTFDGSNAV